MALTMSWSEAEHDPRVSESCGEQGDLHREKNTGMECGQGCSTHSAVTGGGQEPGLSSALLFPCSERVSEDL